MKTLVLIPARLAATRLPGKPLADIGGVAMIVRVWRQAMAAGVGRVAVAAGDADIVAAVVAAGGEAVMTDPDLPSGSDRIHAAVHALDPQGAVEAVINLQGDMPFVSTEAILACAERLQASHCDIATVVAPEQAIADRTNPDVVKAILSLDPGGTAGRCLYFTRSTLYGEGPIWRHVGLYGYRREALRRFTEAKPSPLELREKLEQLRALELGLRIDAAVIADAPLSVDTEADLDAARREAEKRLPGRAWRQ